MIITHDLTKIRHFESEMDQKWFVSCIVGVLCFLNVSDSFYVEPDTSSDNPNNVDGWVGKGGLLDSRVGWRDDDDLNETQTEQPLSEGKSGNALWLNVLTYDKAYKLIEKDKGPQNETKIIFINSKDQLRLYESEDEEEDDAQLQEGAQKNIFHLLRPEGFLSHLISENQSNALERTKRQAEEGKKKCKCRRKVRRNRVRRVRRRRRRRRRRRNRVGQQNQLRRQRRRRRGRGRGRRRGRRRGTGRRRGRRRCVCRKEGGDGEAEEGKPEVEEADGGGEEGTTAGAEGGGEEGEGVDEGGEEGGDEGGGEGADEGGEEGGEEGGDEGEGEGGDEEGGGDGDEGGEDDEEGGEDYEDEGSDEGSDEESDEESDEQEGGGSSAPEAAMPSVSSVPKPMPGYPSVPTYPSVPPYPSRPTYSGTPVFFEFPRQAMPYPNGEVPTAAIPAGNFPTGSVPTYTIPVYPAKEALGYRKEED